MCGCLISKSSYFQEYPKEANAQSFRLPYFNHLDSIKKIMIKSGALQIGNNAKIMGKERALLFLKH